MISAIGKIPLSAYIICRNEADCIGDCIESVGFCRDIVIVDSGSSDGTLAIIADFKARGFPIRLFEKEWPGYAAQKQFALDQCREDWCLGIDADERVDPVLRKEFSRLADMPQSVAGVRIAIRHFLFGYGQAPDAVRPEKTVRVVRRGRGRYALDRKVHEGLILDGEESSIRHGYLLHVRALPLGRQMAKENQYSSLKAEQLHAAGRRPRYARLVFNPAVYFFRQFILRRYFLCGWAGFVHAMTSASYAFMTEAKLLEMHRMRDFSGKN